MQHGTTITEREQVCRNFYKAMKGFSAQSLPDADGMLGGYLARDTLLVHEEAAQARVCMEEQMGEKGTEPSDVHDKARVGDT